MANSQGVIDETLVEDEPLFEEDWSEDEPGQARRWVAPALAIFAVLGWTAFFLWARQAEIMAGTECTRSKAPNSTMAAAPATSVIEKKYMTTRPIRNRKR